MTRFAVKWNASKPIGVKLEEEGKCVTCGCSIDNIQNHFVNNNESVRICLTCVDELSETYQSIFNNNRPKYDK